MRNGSKNEKNEKNSEKGANGAASKIVSPGPWPLAPAPLQPLQPATRCPVLGGLWIPAVCRATDLMVVVVTVTNLVPIPVVNGEVSIIIPK